MIEIRWHGRGGQGVVTAASILGAAAMHEGKYSQSFPFFGAERRGAPVAAFTRIDTAPIRIRSQIYYPDWVVLLDDSLFEIMDPLQGLAEDGGLIVNTRRPPSDFAGASCVITLDAMAIARELLGMPIANTAMLGAVAAAGLVSLSAVQVAICEAFPGTAGDRNAAVAAASYQRSAISHKRTASSIQDSGPSTQDSTHHSARSSVLSPQPFLAHAGAIGVAGTIPTHTGDWALERPTIDAALCNGCLLCWLYCPEGTIQRRATGPGEAPIMVNQDYCKGCGICARECPRGAISMVGD